MQKQINEHTQQAHDASYSDDALSEGNEERTIRVVIKHIEPPLPVCVFRGVMRTLCVLLLAAALALGVPRIFGVQEFNVLTGSMTPAYPVGTLVFTVPCQPSSIQVGDVVTCVMNEDLDVITHRVVANDADARTITTRGDANNNNDAPTAYSNVVGVVRFAVPGAGGVIANLTETTQGRVFGLGALGCIAAASLLADSLYNRMRRETYQVMDSE